MKYIFTLLLVAICIESGYTESLYDDPRYCGFVPRTTSGDIKRDATELKKFQRIHPCPSTGLTEGPCEGWDIDHQISLACGGCDRIWNMQWLPNKIKSCSESYCKDRWERNITYNNQDTIGLNPKGCYSKIITLQ